MAGKEKFPAIVTPRSAQRDVQNAVENIKERIEALEAKADATAKLAGQTSLTVSSISTTTTTTTTTTTYIAGVPLTLPCAVIFQNQTTVVPADPTVTQATFGCFGVAISSAPGVGVIAAGQKATVATAGQVISVGTTFVPFLPVFCGPSGQLTQTPPSGPAVIQVGVAIAAQLILVAPGPTIISGQSIVGQPTDNLLATTDVIWQFNGVFVAARRIVDFVAAGGFSMAVADDPGNNRVIITLGSTVSPFSAQLVEDGWLWDDLDVAEDWESWQDDSFANSSTVTPSIVLSLEDGWYDPDDITDDWELYLQEQLGSNLPSLVLNIEDAWDWAYDETCEDFESWQFDALTNTSTVVGSAVLNLEDGWLDPDDTEDDLWQLVAACTTGWNQNG